MAGQHTHELRPIRPEPENHEDVVSDGDGTVGAQGVEAEDAGAQEGDEGRTPAQVHIPHQPSQAERDEHDITHTHTLQNVVPLLRPRTRQKKPPQATRHTHA